jgi:putative salt-induced outer membrane protein YdiY
MTRGMKFTHLLMWSWLSFFSFSPAGYAEEPGKQVIRDIQLRKEGDQSALGWSHESSLGITMNGGNSESQSYVVRQSTGYAWSEDVLKSSGHFLYGRASGVDVSRNWDIGIRYEHYFTDRFAGIAGNSWEGDSFAGYDFHSNVDIGGKYVLLGPGNKTDFLFTEMGYRFQYESRVAGQDPRYLRNHFGRLYLEGSVAISETVSARAWVEVLPNFSRWEHYFINFEPSLSVSLTKALAVKLAFTGRHDGQPPTGKKGFDYIYTTSLVASY